MLDAEPLAAVPDAEVRTVQEGRIVAGLEYPGDAPLAGISTGRGGLRQPQQATQSSKRTGT